MKKLRIYFPRTKKTLIGKRRIPKKVSVFGKFKQNVVKFTPSQPAIFKTNRIRKSRAY